MKINPSEFKLLAEKYQFPVSRVISLEGLVKNVRKTAEIPEAERVRMQKILLDTAAVLQRETNTAPGGGTFLICGLSCCQCAEADGIPVPSAVPVTVSAAAAPRSHSSGTALPADCGLAAPFAVNNYYGEAVMRLKRISRELGALYGIKKSAMRIFCNSALPEKLIAYLSGIGFYGRNSLIINPLLGSNFIISGLYLPGVGGEEDPLSVPPASGCRGCSRCREACPAAAITDYAVIDHSRCFQALATNLVEIDDRHKAQWGQRIYGCQDCQDACPWNRALTCRTETAGGNLGRLISLVQLLVQSDAELKLFFKNTVLGRAWIDIRAIRRNAIMAAGNSGNMDLLRYLEPYRRNDHEVIRKTACWAIERIRSRQAEGI